MEDVGGEIIDISPLVAISLLWPAARNVIQMMLEKEALRDKHFNIF